MTATVAPPTDQMRRTTANLGLYSLSQVTNALLAIVLIGVITRQLGRSGFGEFSFLYVIAALASLLADFGLGPWLTRSVAEAPARSRALLGQALGLRALLTLAVGLAVLLPAALYLGQPDRLTGLAWMLAYTTGLGFVTILESFLMGHQRADRVALSVIGGKLLEMVSVLAVLQSAGTPTVGNVAAALAAACALRVLGVWALTRLPAAGAGDSNTPGIRRQGAVALLRQAAPFALAGVAWTTYSKVDVLILERFVHAEQLGLYTAGYRVLEALLLIPRSVVGVTFPVVSAAWAAHDRQLSLLRGPTRLLMAIGLATAAGLFVVAADLLAMLFGPQFREATAVVQILAATLPLLFLNQMLSMMLSATHRQGEWLGVLAGVLVLNVSANLLLIPRLGIVGAAWATLISELASLVILGLKLRGRHGRLLSPGWFIRSLIAALLMGVAVHYVPGGLAAQIPTGVLLFGGAALALGVVQREELTALRTRERATEGALVGTRTEPLDRAPLSVVILTHDSTATLDAVLDSVSFADEIVVVDSGSSDDTVERATQRGARIMRHPLDGWSAQRTAGWAAASHDWVLSVDSDEVVDPELAGAIREVTRSAPAETAPRGYRLRVMNYFLGRPLRHGGLERDFHLRLAWRPASRWQGEIHEQLLVDGGVSELRGVLHHYTGLTLMQRLRKVHHYALVRARAEAGVRPARGPWPALLSAIRFLAGRLVVRAGWRDGWHGLVWWWLQATERLLADFFQACPPADDGAPPPDRREPPVAR